MAYDTFTHTGKHLLPDGSPAQGTIEIIPSERLIIDADGNAILSGRVKVQLDSAGAYSVTLPDPNDVTLTPSGFGYTIAARLHHTHLPAVSFGGDQIVGGVLDISDVTTVDPSTFVPDANYVTDAELEAAIGAIPDADPTGLLVVAGGTIDLDDTKDDGYLIGYRLTESTLVEGVAFAAGSYIFERDSSVYGGWTVRTLDVGAQVVPSPDSTAPTAPSLFVDNSGQTQLVATWSGGSDAVGVTQYRSRIDGGAWTTGTSPRTFTGLTESTLHTIDVQAGDAAGNWSASASWTGSTASAGPVPIVDTFTAADATALVGRVPTSGTTDDWELGGGMAYMSGASTPYISGDKVVLGSASPINVCARIPLAGATDTVSVAFDYVITPGSQGGVKIALGDTSKHYYAQVGHNGGFYLLSGDFAYNSGEIAGQPLTGRLGIEATATTITAKINGTTVVSTARAGGSWSNPFGVVAIFGEVGQGFTIDNFEATL